MTKKLCVVALTLVLLSMTSLPLFAKDGNEKAGKQKTFDSLQFAVISDIHLALAQQKGNSDGYRLGLKTTIILENTVQEFNKMTDLDFVLVTGDLTVDAEPWNIDATKAILAKLNVPYYVVLGNHDSSPIPHNEKDQPIGLSKYAVAGAFSGKYGGMEPNRTYYSKEIAKNFVLVALDSTHLQIWDPVAKMADFSGSIDPAQMKWLEATLKANKGKTIIVMQHHGTFAFAPGDDSNHNYWSWFKLDNGKEAQALYKKYGVKAVLSGHHHVSTRYNNVEGVYHFTNSALTSYPMRYTLYNITSKGLSYETKDVPVPAEFHELVKKNFLANKWWRDADHTLTPEGDQKYLDFYESKATMKGSVKF